VVSVAQHGLVFCNGTLVNFNYNLGGVGGAQMKVSETIAFAKMLDVVMQ